MTDIGEQELDQLEDEPVEEEEALPLEGVGYSKEDLRALEAAVTWLKEEVELVDELDYASFFKGVLIARGVRAELAQDAWLLGMLEADEYDELLLFLDKLNDQLDTNQGGTTSTPIMAKRWALPMHLDPEWRLSEQATCCWLGTIEDIECEQVSDLTALAAVDFQHAYNMAVDLVAKHNEIVDPRQDVLVNRVVRGKVMERVDTQFTNMWTLHFTDGSKLVIEALPEIGTGMAVLSATA